MATVQDRDRESGVTVVYGWFCSWCCESSQEHEGNIYLRAKAQAAWRAHKASEAHAESRAVGVARLSAVRDEVPRGGVP